MKKFIVVLLTASLFAGNAYAYGPHGHSMVGAIADKRLESNQQVAAKVKKLLGGLTLAQAATLPDSIKSWDNCNPKKPPSNKPVTLSKRINAELRAFLNANLCSSKTSHHDFHFTDVPVVGDEEYASGTVGRSKFDVVQMIKFCIRVLKNQEPQPNKRAITKSVAVILLAHYLGDIHQPLHVGAEYFDAGGNPFEPTKTKPGFGDQGGNLLTLTIFNQQGGKVSFDKLHGYWDNQAVTTTFGPINKIKDANAAEELAGNEPAGWQLTGAVETWSEQMANEIMPMAREAHERLDFTNIRKKAQAKEISGGDATERMTSSGLNYEKWAGQTVRDEIQKGGLRLAALLEELLK
jgi:hypothetical protein